LQLHVMTGGLTPKMSPSSHLTQYVIGPRRYTCQMASKSVERFQQGAQIVTMTDRQTDHTTEKCVAIRGMACPAKSDST